MYDPRTNLSAQVASEVRRHLGGAVFDSVIPRSVRLSEAPSHGLPIEFYRPDSKGAEAYRALAAEVRVRDDRPSSAFERPGGNQAPSPDGRLGEAVADVAVGAR
jgi:nitrogenase subunit NifH